ncbi:MAG: acyloxyacyl hydrolase [Flavobacteriales bacterium]
MMHLIQGHSYGAELSAERRTTGYRAWQWHYGIPSHGLNYFFLNTGNPQAFGQQHSLSYRIRLPLDKIKMLVHAWQHGFGNSICNKHDILLGIGAGYSTKTWDLRENHQAPVIGSHLNIALTLGYELRMNVIGRNAVRVGMRITHFSNGAFKVPNLGTNNLSLYLSFYNTRKNETFRIVNRPEETPFQNQSTSVAFSSGLKEIQPPLGRKYQAYTISALHDWRINNKSSLGAGLDFFYDTSLKPLMERYQNQTPTFARQMQIGALFSYTLHFNMFELKMQQGVYAKDHWKNAGIFYNRFGLRYNFKKNVFVQLMLKTHFAKADYGEMGIGYTWSKTE